MYYKALFETSLPLHMLDDDAYLCQLGVAPMRVKATRRIAKLARQLLTQLHHRIRARQRE